MTQPVAPYQPGGNAIAQADALLSEVAPTPAPAAGQYSSDELAAIARVDEQKRLEEETSYLGTVATQGMRGALDVLLSPGALVGLAAEGAGELFGLDDVAEFGRDLGMAASGKRAMESAGFVLGGGGQAGLRKSEAVTQTVEDQERAFPTLAAISRAGGAAIAGIPLAAGGGAAGLGTRLAIGAAEGGALGAQSGYEQNASLRDVLTSAAFGASIGFGLTGAAHYGGQAIGRAIDRAENFRAAVKARTDPLMVGTGIGIRAREAAGNLFRGVRDRRQLEKVLGSVEDVSEAQLSRAGGREAREVMTELVKARKRIQRAVEDAGPNPSARKSAEAKARGVVSELLAKKAGDFDLEKWATKPPNALQKLAYRRQILDQVSNDLSDTASRIRELRPSLDFELSPQRAAKLTRNADPVAAIGKLQSRIRSIADTIPERGADVTRAPIMRSFQRLEEATSLPEAMTEAHLLMRELSTIAAESGDDVLSSYASRSAEGLLGDLSSDVFGEAGELYARLAPKNEEAFGVLLDTKRVRDALRTPGLSGKLPAAVRQETDIIAKAHGARAALTGEKIPRDLAKQIRSLETRFEAAESAVTLDSAPLGRVFELLQDEAADEVSQIVGGIVGGSVAGLPGAFLGSIVFSKMRPVVGEVFTAVREGAKAGAKAGARKAASKAVEKSSRFLTASENMRRYTSRADFLATAATEGLTAEMTRALEAMPQAMRAPVTADMTQRLNRLSQDIPRPAMGVKGPMPLSQSEMRRANAMWEATMSPMSVFDDFKRGVMDQEKIDYAWQQYPGIQLAAQAAFIDMWQGLSDADRAVFSERSLTQIDYLLGFGGTVQTSLRQDSVALVDTIAQQIAQSQEQPSGNLDLPSAPTMTQRIARARG